MKLHHNSSIPVREISTNRRIKYIYESDTSSSVGSLQGIQQAMQSASDYELVSITEFLPSNDPVKKHHVLDTLSELGLLVPCILLTYCPGSNIGNLHFMWKVPRNADPMQCLQNSQPL